MLRSSIVLLLAGTLSAQTANEARRHVERLRPLPLLLLAAKVMAATATACCCS